jgi:hypothetical protein
MSLTARRSASSTRPAADVGPVDGQRGQRPLERVAVEIGSDPRQPPDFRFERTANLLEFGLVGDRAEAARVARDLLPQRGQRRFCGRVDEQRTDVVEELVADRPTHRPVAQSLRRVEDLLDPHAGHAALAQMAQIAIGVGEPVRVIDPEAVDEAFAHERDRNGVGLLEHLRILLTHAGQVVDVEEPPVAPGHRIDVEELLAQRSVGPVWVGGIGRHVVGHRVEQDAHPGPERIARQRAEFGLASEIVGDALGVDHVVAVLGPRSGLQRGRQVKVRDPEVAEVGHQRSRVGESLLRRQLEPVGRAELDQVTRFRIKIERGNTATLPRAS